jgi:RNA polymerase sigma factor (sigma-70 family)
MLGSSWESVLDACRVGADWAWRLVYEDVAPSLLRYHRARGTRDAEDLVGDTFVRVVRALDGFEGDEEQFRAWVFAISHRRAIDVARASARRPERPAAPEDLIGRGETGNAEDEALRSLGEQRAREMLDRLTADQRDVLLLRTLVDLTVEQVAAVLGKKPGAVKALQARGLEQIRRLISREAVTL